MAKAEQNPAVDDSGELQSQPVKGRPRWLIIGSFAGIVLLELIILVLFLPTPSQTGQEVSETQAGNLREIENTPIIPDVQGDLETQVLASDLVEVPLETPFTVQLPSRDNTTTTTIRAKFMLLYNKADKSRFEKEYEGIPGRLHSEIYRILKTSDEQDVNDPLTKRICARIRNAANDLFSKPPVVHEVKVLDWYVSID